jgi:hypothetical protein
VVGQVFRVVLNPVPDSRIQNSTQTVYPNQDFGYVVVPGSKVAVFGRMKAEGGRMNFFILHLSFVILNFKEADLGS